MFKNKSKENNIPAWARSEFVDSTSVTKKIPIIKDFDPSKVTMMKLILYMKNWQEEFVKLNSYNDMRGKRNDIELYKENLSKIYRFLLFNNITEALKNQCPKKIWILHNRDNKIEELKNHHYNTDTKKKELQQLIDNEKTYFSDLVKAIIKKYKIKSYHPSILYNLETSDPLFPPLKCVQDCMVILGDIGSLGEVSSTNIKNYIKAYKILPLFGEVNEKISDRLNNMKFLYSSCFQLICGKCNVFSIKNNDKLLTCLGSANNELITLLQRKRLVTNATSIPKINEMSPHSILSLYFLRLIYICYSNVDNDKYTETEEKTVTLLKEFLICFNEGNIDIYGYLVESLVLLLLSYDIIKQSNEIESRKIINFIYKYITEIISSYDNYLVEDNAESDFYMKLMVYLRVISFFSIWCYNNPEHLELIEDKVMKDLVEVITPFMNCIKDNEIMENGDKSKGDLVEDVLYGMYVPFKQYLWPKGMKVEEKKSKKSKSPTKKEEIHGDDKEEEKPEVEEKEGEKEGSDDNKEKEKEIAEENNDDSKNNNNEEKEEEENGEEESDDNENRMGSVNDDDNNNEEVVEEDEDDDNEMFTPNQKRIIRIREYGALLYENKSIYYDRESDMYYATEEDYLNRHNDDDNNKGNEESVIVSEIIDDYADNNGERIENEDKDRENGEEEEEDLVVVTEKKMSLDGNENENEREENNESLNTEEDEKEEETEEETEKKEKKVKGGLLPMNKSETSSPPIPAAPSSSSLSPPNNHHNDNNNSYRGRGRGRRRVEYSGNGSNSSYRLPPPMMMNSNNNNSNRDENEDGYLVVMDAPNIAMRHGGNKQFSCKGIKLCIEYWENRGHKVIGFIPDYYLDYTRVGEKKRIMEVGLSAKVSQIPDDIGLLKELIENGNLIATPSQDYDDNYCIGYAHQHDGIIVSNDMYRDHLSSIKDTYQQRNEKDWLKRHIITYTWVNDEFLPNPKYCFPPKSS